jgi:hypothetical protein
MIERRRINHHNGVKPLEEDPDTLFQRITDCLNDQQASSASITTMMRECEAEAVEADREAAQAEVELHDPHKAADDPAVPFGARQRAEVRAGRLRAALPSLQHHLDAAYVREQHTRWYELHLAKKDDEVELVERFIKEYVECSTKLAKLFRDIAIHDASINDINQMALAGESRRLRPIEHVARNLAGFSLATPSILKTCVLPDFDQSDRCGQSAKPSTRRCTACPTSIARLLRAPASGGKVRPVSKPIRSSKTGCEMRRPDANSTASTKPCERVNVNVMTASIALKTTDIEVRRPHDPIPVEIRGKLRMLKRGLMPTADAIERTMKSDDRIGQWSTPSSPIPATVASMHCASLGKPFPALGSPPPKPRPWLVPMPRLLAGDDPSYDQDCILVCAALAWQTAQRATNFWSNWAVEAPDHCTGRLLQRHPDFDLPSALFTAAEAYLSGDVHQVFGEFGDSSSVLLPAAGGHFAASILQTSDGETSNTHARCKTWLAPEMQVDIGAIVRPAADPTDTVLWRLYRQQNFTPHLLKGSMR